jgi:hypothetical protein
MNILTNHLLNVLHTTTNNILLCLIVKVKSMVLTVRLNVTTPITASQLAYHNVVIKYKT